MANKKSGTDKEGKMKKSLENNLELIKTLLILLVNKLGVDKKDIAKVMGISEGNLSKILNPKKYKRK